jgi:hypothetical protein
MRETQGFYPAHKIAEHTVNVLLTALATRVLLGIVDTRRTEKSSTTARLRYYTTDCRLGREAEVAVWQ